MRLLYLDPIGGVSGDMLLGLLLDLGLPLADLQAGLRALPLTGWQLESRRELRQEIAGCRALVTAAEEHHHRTWLQIDQMLATAPLDAAVAALARRIFRRIGVAEAKVHGIALEQVHFHEVGALDSILDIVGAAIGLRALGIDQVISAPLPMSQGTVQCAHGSFPLPAPATVEILRGCPIFDGRCDKELVTPTGAAIVAEIARFAPLPEMLLTAVGYGVGGRDLPDRPNLLRGLLGEASSQGDCDQVCVLETHLDDANPEWLGALMEQLLRAGALDVGYSPLQMKKNRPGVRITVIAPPPLAEDLSRLLLHQSSAIGVRRTLVERRKLRRQSASVATALGEAAVKLIYEGEQLLRITPEFDSCRQLSEQSGRPLPEVYRLVERAADRFYLGTGCDDQE
ncbi:MAG: nickel pincer cofactor biosynthesis protein LarC [Trichloromonadaceae bacterium]